jgi:hypothetical protein
MTHIENTKIDVQKYADAHGLTLEQANTEIQTWMFEQGYAWPKKKSVPCFVEFPYLFVYGRVRVITFCEEHRHFRKHPHKEITFQRSLVVSLTPEAVQQKELVEFMGKKYHKADLMFALAKLEEQK